MTFSEQEFYQQQHQHDRRWGRAINFAVIFHVLIFIGAFYLPNIFDRKPLLDDILTIDLVSLPETPMVVEKEPEPVKRPEPAPEPKPAPSPEPVDAVPIEVSVKPAPKPEPAPLAEVKPVSIHPLKRKVKRARDTRLEEEKLREQHALDLKRRQREQQRARQKAIVRARQEEQRAKEEVRRARAEIAAVIREQASLHAARPSTSGSGSGNRQVNSAVEKQYYMDLAARVQRLWILPELKKWSPSLETIVEFTVLRDGRLINVKVAHSSGDVLFDRFARETVKKAAPMPPFPAVLKKARIDLGFRLRPAGVQH